MHRQGELRRKKETNKQTTIEQREKTSKHTGFEKIPCHCQTKLSQGKRRPKRSTIKNAASKTKFADQKQQAKLQPPPNPLSNELSFSLSQTNESARGGWQATFRGIKNKKKNTTHRHISAFSVRLAFEMHFTFPLDRTTSLNCEWDATSREKWWYRYTHKYTMRDRETQREKSLSFSCFFFLLLLLVLIFVSFFLSLLLFSRFPLSRSRPRKKRRRETKSNSQKQSMPIKLSFKRWNL